MLLYCHISFIYFYVIKTYSLLFYLFTGSGLGLVSAWRTTSVYSVVNPVPFDTVGANIGDMWDSNTHKFTMKAEQGVFYVAMDAGVLRGKALNFVLMKSNQPFTSCSHTYTVDHYNADSTGKDIIMRLNESETLHFTSSTGLFCYRGASTNIAIFNIAELMSSDKDPVVFSVARNSMLRGNFNPVTFNQILFNDYSHFNVSTNRFTAPSSGIYFFTLSVGVTGGLPVQFMLYVNDVPFTNIIRESTARKGTDVIGRSIMMNLNKSDTVHVGNKRNTLVYSSQLLETSFAGFKCEPIHQNQVSDTKYKLIIVNNEDYIYLTRHSHRHSPRRAYTA